MKIDNVTDTLTFTHKHAYVCLYVCTYLFMYLQAYIRKAANSLGKINNFLQTISITKSLDSEISSCNRTR